MSATWTLYSSAPPSKREPAAEEWDYDEQQVKIACELSLFFMLLHMKGRMKWYEICVERAWEYPMGSYRDVFWWALRLLPDDNYDLAKFRDYLEWKISQYDKGIIRREAGRW
jgi:hypothetical protein